MSDIYNLVVTNAAILISIVYGLDLTARGIVKLTSTDADDKFLAKVESALALLGVDVEADEKKAA